MRRHASPAFIALVVAASIALIWPGDLRIVSTQRSGAAVEASLGPASGGSTPSAAPASLTSLSSAEPSTALQAPVITVSSAEPSPAIATPTQAAAPVAAGAQPATDASGSERAPSAPSVSLRRPTAVVDLPANVARRRSQTWEAPPPPWTLDGYVWPLPGGRITDTFGPSPWGSRVVDGQLFHDGIDIASYCGDRVVAAHAGVVLAAGRAFDTMIGWIGDLRPYLARLDEKKLRSTLPITVVIDDGNGYRSIYAHFYQVAVKPGKRVRAGQFLGYEGATGRATGCHLHYGLFAPHETATFAIEPSVVERMLVPRLQIARIDPLLVLPRRAADVGSPPAADPGSGHGLAE